MDNITKNSFHTTMETIGWSLVGVTPEIKEKFISLVDSRIPPDIQEDIIKIAERPELTISERQESLYIDTSTLFNYLKKSSSVRIIKYDFVRVVEPISGKFVIMIFKTKKPISMYLDNNLLGTLASRLVTDPEDIEYEYCGFTSEKDEMIMIIFE